MTTLKKYRLYFIKREANGLEAQWEEETIPALYDAEGNKVALSMQDFMHLRGFKFVDGGYEREENGALYRVINREGYAKAVEVE